MKLIKRKETKVQNLSGRMKWVLLDPKQHHLSSLSSCVIQIPPGEKVFPAHTHPKSDEFIYIISGEGSILVNNETYPVDPGTAILIEAGETHSLSNECKSVMEALCVFVPPIIQ